MANPRRYRSRSSDNDRWIEHTPGQPVKSGTVFQPVMKKKKSVVKLTDADDVVRRTKYCLNLQQPDGEGGVETKLYKVRHQRIALYENMNSVNPLIITLTVY